MNNQTAVKQLGDIQEMVDVWMNFVKNNKRFQIVQNRFTGQILALKVIDNVGIERGWVNRDEPYKLGCLTSWGKLDVSIIESEFSDNFNCLETTAQMKEAYEF